METGFGNTTTDPEFARRSASYLASNGYRPQEIRLVLLEELRMPVDQVDDIVHAMAA